MKLQCPHCGVRGTADDSLRGRSVRCGRCAKNFIAGEEQPPFEAEEKIAVTCPECGRQGRMDAALRGCSITCPGCGSVFVSPPPAAPAAAASAAGSSPRHVSEQEPEWKRAPQSLAGGESGERLIREDGDFDVVGILTSSLGHVVSGGFFFRIFLGSVILFILSTFVQLTIGMIGNVVELVVGSALVFALKMAFSIGFGGMIFGGLLWLALCHCRGDSLEMEMVFHGLAKYCRWKLFTTRLVGFCLVLIGFFLFFVPGIYLFIGYYFAQLLVLDHGIDFWEALETSRRAVHRVFWKFSFALSLFYLPWLFFLAAVLRPFVGIAIKLVEIVQANPEVVDNSGNIDIKVIRSVVDGYGEQLLLPLFLYVIVTIFYMVVTPVFKAEVYQRLFAGRRESEEKTH